ncbi:N-acyl-L-amino acid amidohydrolase [hydrothermal vent metagenome]|uniref:N-acyl-L-amino acid amidohydrolase n=1 Tax=hydrothermal vent metagenome TaxID=652676 RepID=A0A3B1BY71_9ZZZZ
MNAKQKIAKTIVDLSSDMAKINRAIFDKPELCYEEVFAAQLTADYLESNGFTITKPFAGLKTAFLARHKGKGKGPNIALIAEYDALPQIGHACGHSMIAATACGAAVAIAKTFPEHPGSLLVIGTPAEEGGGGKIKMIDKGVFKNVDAAIMVHPSNKTRVIARMYAIHDMEVTFTGRSAHAAAFPDQGINALDAGVLFYNAVSALRQQIRGEARIHGIFTHGGDAPNIIPEKVIMRFFVRALDALYFRELVGKVKECARGAAKSTGCKVKFKKIGYEYEPFYPSHPIGYAFRKNMSMAGIEEENFGEAEEIGSSDIGNLSQIIPTLHPEYAIGDRGDINHSRNFLKAVMSKKGEKMMLGMTQAMAMTVYDLLSDPKLLASAKKEFKNQKQALA